MTSRRDFLKKAGLLSAAFAVPAFNVNGDTPQSKIRLRLRWTIDGMLL